VEQLAAQCTQGRGQQQGNSNEWRHLQEEECSTLQAGCGSSLCCDVIRGRGAHGHASWLIHDHEVGRVGQHMVAPVLGVGAGEALGVHVHAHVAPRGQGRAGARHAAHALLLVEGGW